MKSSANNPAQGGRVHCSSCYDTCVCQGKAAFQCLAACGVTDDAPDASCSPILCEPLLTPLGVATTREVIRGAQSATDTLERKLSLPQLQGHTLIGAETLGSFILSGYIHAVLKDYDAPELSNWSSIAEDSLSLWRRDSDDALSAVLRIRFASSISNYELGQIEYTLGATDLGPGSHAATLSDRTLTLVASTKPQLTTELSDPALGYLRLTYAELDAEYVDTNIALASPRNARTWR